MSNYNEIYNYEMPINEYLLKNKEINDDLHRKLSIVYCNNCGHAFNELYNDFLTDDLYTEAPIPANPVSPNMHSRLNNVLDWIGLRYYNKKNVIEIGAGSGHLSRIIANKARSVTIYEPCNTLTKTMLPEKNINLFSKNYKYDRTLELFDFGICRQVIEHIKNPLDFIIEIKKSLKPHGYVYLEVPNAEYIYNNKMIVDFHFQHVQYFTEHSFLKAIEMAGMQLIKKQYLMDNHDMGFLLKNNMETNNQSKKNESLKNQNFNNEIIKIRNLLKSIDGSIALYGANTHGQIFFNLINGVDNNVAVAFDDSEYLYNYSLFNKNRKLEIINPKAVDINSYNNIIITAYLHQKSIINNLKELGFDGQIFTMANEDIHKGN